MSEPQKCLNLSRLLEVNHFTKILNEVIIWHLKKKWTLVYIYWSPHFLTKWILKWRVVPVGLVLSGSCRGIQERWGGGSADTEGKRGNRNSQPQQHTLTDRVRRETRTVAITDPLGPFFPPRIPRLKKAMLFFFISMFTEHRRYKMTT